MDASIVLVLKGGPEQALRCFGALAELPDDPGFEVVVVDNASVGLEDLLERLAGDVTVARAHRRVGAVDALRLGLERCTAEHVVLLRGAPVVGADWLAPLISALGDPSVAGAVSVAPHDPSLTAVATHALAVRRADLDALGGLPPAPDGLELAALVAALARRGEVRPVPASIVTAPDQRTVGARGALGAEVELSVVIPTLDATSDRVRSCVAAVQATVEAPHEIILIDNGAPPQGFTAPVNAGLRAARGAYAVVMNDDVEPLAGWWGPLRDRLDAGAAVVFPHTEGGEMRHDFAAWCFAISRATLDTYAVLPGEFLDPRLVVWYQDTDLLHRLRQDRRPPVYVAESRIRHGLSQTLGSQDPALRAWIREQVVADQAAFEAKHGTNVPGATPARA